MGTSKIKTKKGRTLYGRRVIREYINSGLPTNGVISIHLQNNLPDDLITIIKKAFPKTKIQVYSRNEMITAFEGHHQGVLFEFAPESYPGFASTQWKDFLKKNRGPHLILDRINDSQNLGNILRSAEALGATSIFCCGQGASIDEVVHRISSGASFHIPAFSVQNLNQVIEHVKKENYWVCASGAKSDLQEPHSKKSALFLSHNDTKKLPDKKDIVLLVGSEGEGLKKSAILNSDFVLSIDLHGKTASLNASIATAILLDRIISN